MLTTARVVTPEELVVKRFAPTTIFVREAADFHTRLCVYNYFSELFPDVKTGATVHIWFFDSSGEFVAHREFRLGYRGQLQYDLSELGVHFEGTAGLSLVPDTVPEFKHDGVGTGYYSFYYDDHGHADFSHEWDSMRFKPVESVPWLCVIRPLRFDTQLIVVNSYYGLDREAGTCHWTARLRNGQGAILEERKMPPIPPRGSVRLPVKEIFPNVLRHADREKVLAIEAQGTNMQGPFSFVTAPGGDFNIHHFC